MGAALAPAHDQVMVATKFGVLINDNHSLTFNSPKANRRTTVEKSLRQLVPNYLDLVYRNPVALS